MSEIAAPKLNPRQKDPYTNFKTKKRKIPHQIQDKVFHTNFNIQKKKKIGFVSFLNVKKMDFRNSSWNRKAVKIEPGGRSHIKFNIKIPLTPFSR